MIHYDNIMITPWRTSHTMYQACTPDLRDVGRTEIHISSSMVASSDSAKATLHCLGIKMISPDCEQNARQWSLPEEGSISSNMWQNGRLKVRFHHSLPFLLCQLRPLCRLVYKSPLCVCTIPVVSDDESPFLRPLSPLVRACVLVAAW